MPKALSDALKTLFADPNIGPDAVHIADGGAPVPVCVVARRADAATKLGDARHRTETRTAKSIDAEPDVQAFRTHVHAFDQQQHDAGLSGGQEFVPQRIELP
jgi:hypothetical protein